MKVVHVGLESTEVRSGGLNRYLAELVAAQRRRGIDASAVVLGASSPDVAVPDGTVVAGPARGPWLFRAARVDRAVRELLRTGPTDVADLHFAGTAVVTSVLGALRRTPTVVHFQGPWADESTSAGASRGNVAIKRAVERTVYRRADHAVTLSKAFKDLLVRRYGVAPWRVSVLAPGVDLERFTPGDRAAARATLDLPGGRVVLAVRRLVPRMGLDVLVDAWKLLAPRPDDLLVIVGGGPELEALRAHATRAGVGASVRFVGGVDDDELARWYRAADVTVVPSMELEGFGLVVLESLASGTPVVGTDAAGLGEALEMTGQLPTATAGDPVSLADRLREVLDAAPGDERVNAVACRRAAQRHGWDAVALRHRELYDEVASGSRRLRVVVLDHTAVLSGGELALARALDGVRATASVHAVLGAEGPLRARLEAAGASVEVLAMDERARTVRRGAVRVGTLHVGAIFATIRYVVVLVGRLRELRPDVVHTNSLKAALYGGVASRLARVPCVWHVRDRVASPELPTGAVRLVRRAARMLPTVVVANSISTLKSVGVDGRVVPSPLDPSIDPHRAKNVHEGAARFAVVGRLAPWKGQRLALEAFADAFPGGAETLQIAGSPMFGEDDYANELARVVDELGLAGRVELRGFVDDVAALLDDTDVVVHSSVLPEPFGQVIVEAMGAGCAVLVADAGGPSELVDDGIDGVRYEMGDRAALASAMRALASDPALRSTLGAAAQRKAATYTPAALAPLLLGAWRDASAPASRRRRRADR